MKLIIAQGGGHISMESENPLLYTLDSINHSENIITPVTFIAFLCPRQQILKIMW